jgi:hypothetical protein
VVGQTGVNATSEGTLEAIPIVSRSIQRYGNTTIDEKILEAQPEFLSLMELLLFLVIRIFP